jgi:Tfp pilus assembly protein PilO
VNVTKQRLPLPAVIALIVVAALLAAAAGWFLLVSPKRAEAHRLADEIEATQAQVTAYHAASLQAKGRTPIKVADLFRLSKAMPDRADMSGVLLQLNQIAADTGITFQSITPQTSVPISGYQAMPIQLTFQGTFYNLADFLFRLRNLVSVQHGQLSAAGRLFAVDTLSFAQAQEGFPQITATLVVDAFVYGTETTATATPSTTSATTTSTTAGATTTTSTPPASSGATAAGAPSSG